MRLAFLGSNESWYFRDLLRAAGGRHEIVVAPFSQLQAKLEVNEGRSRSTVWSDGQNLQNFDAVLVRSMPPGSLEQVVFRMDLLARLEASGTFVFNPPRAMEVAIDKFLTSERLAAAGLAVPAMHVSQTWEEAMQGFGELGGDVVVKPLFGSEGRGITRINDEALALRAFKMLAQFGAVIYQQKFIEHEGCDVRVLVLGDQAWAIRRRNANDWRTNVALGATAEPQTLSNELEEIARRAALAVGAPFAGVDLLPGRDGTLYAIEVNAVPGWKALAQTLQVDVAAEVLAYVGRQVGTMRESR